MEEAGRAAPSGLFGDPLTALHALERMTSVHDLGAARVDGQAVEHYRAVEHASQTAPTTDRTTATTTVFDLYIDSANPPISRAIAIDPRFRGFVTTDPSPGFVTKADADTYELRLRDGTVLTCGTASLHDGALDETAPTCPSPEEMHKRSRRQDQRAR